MVICMGISGGSLAIGLASAHMKIEGNRRTDALTKPATEYKEIRFELPVPFWRVKGVLKERIIFSWQDRWGETGKRHSLKETNNLIPSATISFPHPPQQSSLGMDLLNNIFRNSKAHHRNSVNVAKWDPQNTPLSLYPD